jgi:opacity protein-like surface antigen
MKFALFAATAIAALSFNSAAMAQDSKDKNGFYAGIVAGYSYTDLDLEAGPIGGSPNQFDQAYMHAGEFGLVGGYHYVLPRNFFVEAEAEALVSFGDEQNLFNSGIEVEKDGAVGIYVKPGYQIDERWGTFLTLGAQWVEYSVKNPANGYDESDSAGGFLMGIGANYRLDKDVSITAEYNRVQPLDVKYEYVPGVTGSRFDPELDIVKVALKYHF